MPIGSPRVSLVNSILGEKDWKNWKKIHRIRGFPLARYGWEKTSLTLESISMRSPQLPSPRKKKKKKTEVSDRKFSIRTKSCDASISLRKEDKSSKRKIERIEKKIHLHRSEK